MGDISTRGEYINLKSRLFAPDSGCSLGDISAHGDYINIVLNSGFSAFGSGFLLGGINKRGEYIEMGSIGKEVGL